MMMPLKPNVIAIFLAILVTSLLTSCPSSDVRDDAEANGVLTSGPEPGPIEEQMRQYVIDMTNLLLVENPDPQETVRSVGGYLQVNQDAMREAARQLRNRVMEMSPAERVYYEDRFSTYFADATRGWYAALEQFRSQHPDQALLVDGLMMRFD
jgi:hypothetical protein